MSSATWVLLLLAWGAALASLAASLGQLALLVMGFIALWTGFGGMSFRYATSPLNKAAQLLVKQFGLVNPVAFFLPLFVALALMLAVCGWQSSSRKRAFGFALALVSLAFANTVDGWFEAFRDFVNRPPLSFTASALSLQTKAAPGDQVLWPALTVRGLPPEHVASVLSLAPAGADAKKLKSLPPNERQRAFLSDYGDGDGGRRQRLDEAHILSRHYGATDLWFDHLSSNAKRADLRKLWGKQAPAVPWRLRLAVHEMRLVLDLPLAEFIHSTPSFTLPDGWRFTFEPLREGSHLQLPLRMRRLRSEMAPLPPDHLDDYAAGMFPWSEIRLVVQDAEARENQLIEPNSDGPTVGREAAFCYDAETGFNFTILKPKARMALTGLLLEDWMKQARVQLWLPEKRGTVDFELTAEQMKEVLFAEPPKAPATK